MTTLAVPPVGHDEATLPPIVWAFVQRIVDSGVPGQVYTYIYRGVVGATEYVLTPVEVSLPDIDRGERSIVLAARPRTPGGPCTFRTLTFRREKGVWVKTSR